MTLSSWRPRPVSVSSVQTRNGYDTGELTVQVRPGILGIGAVEPGEIWSQSFQVVCQGRNRRNPILKVPRATESEKSRDAIGIWSWPIVEPEGIARRRRAWFVAGVPCAEVCLAEFLSHHLQVVKLMACNDGLSAEQLQDGMVRAVVPTRPVGSDSWRHREKETAPSKSQALGQRTVPGANLIPLGWRNVEHQQLVRRGTADVDAEVNRLQWIVFANSHQLIDFQQPDLPLRRACRQVVHAWIPGSVSR